MQTGKLSQKIAHVNRNKRKGTRIPRLLHPDGSPATTDQQWCVAGSQARQEDRVRSVASSRAILGPREPAIHLHCPRICRWWIRKRPADEGSRGGIGDGPGRVAVG